MIRFFIYFIVSFTILSVPVKDRKLFYHLDEMAHPITKHVIARTKNIASNTFGEVKIWGISLIEKNKSRIAKKEKQDKVTSKMAAPNRNLIKLKAPSKPAEPAQLERKSEVLGVEYYSKEELQKLQNMLQESEY